MKCSFLVCEKIHGAILPLGVKGFCSMTGVAFTPWFSLPDSLVY